MKTYNSLYGQVASFSNLYRAWQKARKGKRKRPATITFQLNLDRELLTLEEELVSERYIPSEYASFYIHDPKRRKISAAPFRDRVVHHALCNVIEPIYDHKFIFDSYANRKNKGTHRALDRCTEFMRQYRYVLPCDVKQFFPSIDHQILKSILARTIVCHKTNNLCEKIIDSGTGILNAEYDMQWFEGDDLFAANRPRGLPIGNLTSQFWANVYLNGLDQFVKHTLRCKGYLRYVDDFLLFSNDRQQLAEWKAALISYLASLRLKLHEERLHSRPVDTGASFLGFVVFPTHRRLRYHRLQSYRRHVLGLHRAYQKHAASRDELDASIHAWIGHVKHGDTWGLRTQLFDRLTLQHYDRSITHFRQD